MSKGPWITPQQVASVKAMLAAGMRRREIAASMGLHIGSIDHIAQGRIRGWLRKFPYHPRRRKVPAEQLQLSVED